MISVYTEIADTLEKLSKCYIKLAQKHSSIQENLSQTSKKKEITIEEVRAVLAEKSKCGKTSEVKALLAQFGASKLSQVKEEDFQALILESQKL